MKLIRDEELLTYIKNHDYELVSRMGCVDRGMFTDGIEHAINVQEAVEVMEVVHGHWINTAPYTASNGQYNKAQQCSVCNAYFVSSGNTPYSNHPYCCECGSKMDEEVTWLNS